MKTINTKLNKTLILLIAFFSLTAWSELKAQAELVKEFKQRTSVYSPERKIYNIRGDFQMIGNTNLTLQNYTPTGNNSAPMMYVDIDEDGNTLNSSSAKLEFPQMDNDEVLNHNCTNIIYAGLYWTGRAHDNVTSSPNTWTVNNSNLYNNDVFKGYTLSITAQNHTGTDGRLAIYTFTPDNGGDKVTFRFHSWRTGGLFPSYHGSVTVQIGNGAQTNIPGSITSSDNENYTFKFSSSYTINTGTETLIVNSLRKRRINNEINNTYRAIITLNKTLDKRKVKLKYGNENYITVTANADDIYYPTTNKKHSYMYSAYAEVTDYVKEHGIGEYFVADIALNEGNGGNTGFYGGWGMIVIYENFKMKWRDVTIFDGYAYIKGDSNPEVSQELEVSGFRTPKNGDVGVKLGIIAGEGDVGISGDYFEIQKGTTNQWQRLRHDGHPAGVTNNFFNSSIPAANASDNPKLTNNTGLDIAMFTIDNADKSIIGNNQTATKFKYGSRKQSNGQDSYIISCIAMAVDAYVPDIVPVIEIGTINGALPGSGNEKVRPGEEIEYTLEIKNPGNERILNAVIDIPIPYTATLVEGSVDTVYYHGTGTNRELIITSDTIKWDIGTIPKGEDFGDPDTLLAKLTFKLRATTDCFFLVNEHCIPKILLVGSVSGKGELSESEFSNLRFIHGYQQAGECEGQPLTGPLATDIDAADYVTEHCGDFTGAIKEFKFCEREDPNINPIEFSQIASYYPLGTRFWSAIETDTIDNLILVKPAEDAIEYTATNNFPNIDNKTYFALPPGIATCWWEFKIRIVECNFWMGSTGNADPVIDTHWGTASNWTGNKVPLTDEDIIYATVANYGEAAKNDLKLDINRSVGDVINGTDKKLIIPTNKTLIINGKANTGTVDQLVIQSKLNEGNGALIFGNPSINSNVQATVEYDSKSQKTTGTYPREWQYIGSPVQGATPASVFGPNVTGSKYGPADHVLIRKYSEAYHNPSDIGEKWINIDVNAVMSPFAGYEIVQPTQNTKIYQFKGALNVGDFTTGDLEFTEGAYYRGNYIIANSYVAPINIHNLQAADFVNLEQTIYLYNTGSRDQWLATTYGTIGAGNPGTFYTVPIEAAPTLGVQQIPSLNGFMVRRLKKLPANPTPGQAYYDPTNPDGIRFNFKYARLEKVNIISPTEPMRVKAAETTSSDKYPLLKVDVIASDGVDRAFLLTVPNTTKGFDNGWDGYKMRTRTDAQIYSFVNGTDRYQVSSDCNLDGTILGFYNGTNETNFTLKFHFQDMEGVYDLLTITDLETGVTSDITDGGTVSFAASKSSPEARFKINGKKVPTINEDLESPISIQYDKSQKLFVTNNGKETGTITIYDVAGSLIYESAMPLGFNSYKVNLPQGVFIIEAKTAKYRSQIKVITQ